MIIVMGVEATDANITEVVNRIVALGYDTHLSRGEERTIIGVVAKQAAIDRDQVLAVTGMPGVVDVVAVSHPYKLASREFHPAPTTIALNGTQLGTNKLAIIAGPCSVESRQQILETAHAVKEAGATALRGGAFKPRTSPFAFQGLGEEGLKYLAEAREVTGLPIVTEIMDPALVEMFDEYADVLQIGARNMQNYTLLNAVGKSKRAILLKRGMSSTVEEMLMAADYALHHHNPNVILCERGIRTFETATRNTFDINAIPVLKERSHLPVIADPSHATGKSEYVEAASLAAIAAGADGLILEVHTDPARAVSDGRQSLNPAQFAKLVQKIRRVAEAVERTF